MAIRRSRCEGVARGNLIHLSFRMKVRNLIISRFARNDRLDYPKVYGFKQQDEAVSSNNKKKLTFFILLFLAILLILLEYAPHYLTYADIPVKSDAVVLFVGADSRVRQEGANLLITQGYARYFLIPAYGKIQDIWGHDPISPEIGIVYPDVLKPLCHFDFHSVISTEGRNLIYP